MAELKHKEGYWVNQWSKLDNYNCDLCAFASVHKDAIEEHLWSEHGFSAELEPAAPTIDDLIADAERVAADAAAEVTRLKERKKDEAEQEKRNAAAKKAANVKKEDAAAAAKEGN
jgi:hypothetical protein